MKLILELIFFYEFVRWDVLANSIGNLFGEGSGIIIAALLKMISIFIITPILLGVVIIIPCLCAYLIISKYGREQHAKKMQKLLGVLQRKCRFNKTAGKHSFKY